MDTAYLQSVVDGDTLRLKDGRKLRLIGINTPELGRGGKVDEPQAVAAKGSLQSFLGDDARLYLQLGVDSKDRYGRTLAHVYRADGASLSAHLLAAGLAMQVVVPANIDHWQCYQSLQQLAREAHRGVWAQADFQPAAAARLGVGLGGFMQVTGRVEQVSPSKSRWWLNMGELAVSVHRNDEQYFKGWDWPTLKGQTITVRGWVIDRRDSRAVRENGYPPYMLSLRHPAMIDLDVQK